VFEGGSSTDKVNGPPTFVRCTTSGIHPFYHTPQDGTELDSDMRTAAACERIHMIVVTVQYRAGCTHEYWRLRMLMTLAIVLIVLWLLGMVSAYTMGGLIHVLLVVAVIVVLVRVVQGRKVL